MERWNIEELEGDGYPRRYQGRAENHGSLTNELPRGQDGEEGRRVPSFDAHAHNRGKKRAGQRSNHATSLNDLRGQLAQELDSQKRATAAPSSRGGLKMDRLNHLLDSDDSDNDNGKKANNNLNHASTAAPGKASHEESWESRLRKIQKKTRKDLHQNLHHLSQKGKEERPAPENGIPKNFLSNEGSRGKGKAPLVQDAGEVDFQNELEMVMSRGMKKLRHFHQHQQHQHQQQEQQEELALAPLPVSVSKQQRLTTPNNMQIVPRESAKGGRHGDTRGSGGDLSTMREYHFHKVDSLVAAGGSGRKAPGGSLQEQRYNDSPSSEADYNSEAEVKHNKAMLMEEVRQFMYQEKGRSRKRKGRSKGPDPMIDPNIDPKQARRIISNRKSAAKSKLKLAGEKMALKYELTKAKEENTMLIEAVAAFSAEVKEYKSKVAHLETENHFLLKRLSKQEEEAKYKTVTSADLEFYKEKVNYLMHHQKVKEGDSRRRKRGPGGLVDSHHPYLQQQLAEADHYSRDLSDRSPAASLQYEINEVVDRDALVYSQQALSSEGVPPRKMVKYSPSNSFVSDDRASPPPQLMAGKGAAKRMKYPPAKYYKEK